MAQVIWQNGRTYQIVLTEDEQAKITEWAKKTKTDCINEFERLLEFGFDEYYSYLE